MSLSEFLAAIGGTAIFAGAGALVLRKLIDVWADTATERFRIQAETEASIRLESFRIQTQQTADIERERIAGELRRLEFEHHTAFSKLHEKRVEVLTEIYVALAETHHKFIAWVRPIRWVGEGIRTEEEEGRDAITSSNHLVDLVNRHGIWLSEPLQNSLDQLTKKFFDISNDFQDRKTGEARISWRTIWDQIAEDVPTIRKAIEQECRAILDPAPPA